MKINVDEKNLHVIAFRQSELKLRELNRERSAKTRQLDEELERQRRARSSRSAQIDAEAEQLLAGEQLTEKASHDSQRLEHEIAVLDRALEKQSELIAELQARFSRAVQELNHEQYLKIEHRIAAAIKELSSANLEEQLFFDALLHAGCSAISLRPMRVGFIGLPPEADPQGFCASWEREFAEFVH